MALGIYRTAIGVMNGVNRTFFSPTPYEVTGETRFVQNGQMLGRDCITEVDGATGELRFEAAVAPRVGEDLLIYYFEAGSLQVPDVVLVLPLHGRLKRCDRLQGSLQSLQTLTGTLKQPTTLRGTLSTTQSLRGRMSPVKVLKGIMTTCPPEE